jgi:hypothetical protein
MSDFETDDDAVSLPADGLVDGDEMRHIELSLLMQWFRPDDMPRKSKRARLHLTFIQKIQLSRFFTVRRSDGAVFVQRKDEEPKYMKPNIGTCGYKRISCVLDGEQKYIKQHQLVLLAYFGEELKKCALDARANGDMEYAFVDDWYPHHIDHDPPNCAVANLSPIRHRENSQRSYEENLERKTCAEAQSRPVVVARHLESVDPTVVLQFPVGHEFKSASDAALQTGLVQGNISQSARTGWQCAGWFFKYGALESDKDYPSEIWRPSGVGWCRSLGGPGVRVSSHGRIWFKQGSIKTHGAAQPNDKYRKLKVGPESLAHRVLKRVWDGERDKDGRWIACEVPPGMFVLHGGEGRAFWHERRDADGCERNWQVDLYWGTLRDNANDVKREAAYLAAQAKQQ